MMQKPIVPESRCFAHASPRFRPRGRSQAGRRALRSLGAGLAVLLAAFLAGCSQPAPSDPNIWAEVNGKPIYRQDVERHYRGRSTAQGEAGDPEQELSLKLNILNELINNQILLAHAAHSRINVSEGEVDNRLAQLRSPYGSEENFNAKLQEQGVTLSEFRQEIHNNLIITKLINKEIKSRLSVSDEDIRAYYQRNKASFDVPEIQYHLAQILVTPVADAQVRNIKKDDAETPAAALHKIQAIYARLRAGDDFSTLAQEYSEDPRTAAGGGDMGFIAASSVSSNADLKKALAELKPGQISGIIHTQSGYHILKLLGVEKPGQHTLDDPQVESAIRNTLTNEKEQLLTAAFIEQLRDRAKVRNFLADRVVAAGGVPAGAQ
jgi:peptidyl-prolyl cis-trans isomerase SurA